MVDDEKVESPVAQEEEAPAEPVADVSDAAPGDELNLAEDELILVAVRGMVLFPGVVFPILVGRERSVAALQAAVQDEQPIGLLVQKDHDDADPRPEDLYAFGTQAVVLRYLTAPDGTHHAITQGQKRFRVLEFTGTDPFLRARVEVFEEDESELSTEQEARFKSLRQLAQEAISLLPEENAELASAIANAATPGGLADLLATFMEISVDEKQEILEILDVDQRVQRVFSELQKAVEVLRLSRDITQQTKGALDKAQKDYYLREQLKQIQNELGEGGSAEIEELREALAQAELPDEAHEHALKELARLERTPEASMEHGMIRTYLDWMIELPWSRSTEDSLDIARAREILDEDHYGLEKVKRRIVEFLAVRKLKPDGKGPILCLVGPPGVGKTSLGHSIARAMGRQFVRISLGGVHDEAEVRGHRRTYVGSMPGRIIQSIRRADANNPVFMLDEMDKLGQGFHGDPSSALLEVLDPEQNKAFNDHYLEVPFDLSKAMFIATANVLHAIPGPLRDRCEVIELPGYTEEEKLEIARRYLVKRRLEANGVNSKQCKIPKATLREIVRGWTREAGCRNLEREIGSVVRHVATKVAMDPDHVQKIEPADLPAILGPRRFEDEVAARVRVPGVATGLAWTPVGGQILFIEATSMPGKGQLILTGQLGDVMQESGRAAYSLLKANADTLGIDAEVFAQRDVHMHVPAGGIPKDGPSAGVTMYTALVSLFTGRKVRSSVAMTGEVSLRGLVLPVGGIKEKVLAAQAAGIKTVLLPKRNVGDLEEVPQSAKKKLTFVPLETVDEALAEALEGGQRKKRKKRRRGRGTGRSDEKVAAR